MMKMDVRRVVTGHNVDGKAVFGADETLEGLVRLPPGCSGEIIGCEVWAVKSMPVDNSEEAAAAQSLGSRGVTAAGTGQGINFRITELPGGVRSPMHRTVSLDFALLLEGECDIELDSGEVKHLVAGDVVIQRGTNHVWENKTDKPCRFAYILIDADPVKVGDRTLEPEWEGA